MSHVIPFRRRSRYPFCQVSKQERRREWECAIIGIGGWKYDPRENREARDHALPLGASGEGDRLCAECAQAGFCHEDLFMSDSAMPTGCAGGLAGARRMVVLETHPASMRLTNIIACFAHTAFSSALTRTTVPRSQTQMRGMPPKSFSISAITSRIGSRRTLQLESIRMWRSLSILLQQCG